jgi:hypothetical protein
VPWDPGFITLIRSAAAASYGDCANLFSRIVMMLAFAGKAFRYYSRDRLVEGAVPGWMRCLAPLFRCDSVQALIDGGRIEAGRRPGLLLVDGDPSRDARASRHIVDVWRRHQPTAMAPASFATRRRDHEIRC